MATIEEDAFPDFCSKPVLILGIGNVFFGDDGFEQKSGKASSSIIAMTASGAAWR